MSSNEIITIKRETKETQISASLDLTKTGPVKIDTSLGFFDHMLTAMAFHGGFGLSIEARGDTHVDDHHLVEDTGLVLGDLFRQLAEKRAPLKRYGHSLIPMDDSLCEAVVDVSKRPYLSYRADYPQSRCKEFEICLLKEFFLAFSNRAEINLHLIARYGDNSHHIAEALFKSLGRALAQGYATSDAILSTKGSL